MKLDKLFAATNSVDLLIAHLDLDKSGEVYSLSELMEKLDLHTESSSLRPSNPKLRNYALRASSRGGRAMTFYGNPAVVERAKKYIREKK